MPPSKAFPFEGHKEGLRVVLEPIPGVSDKGVLGLRGYTFQCPPLETFAISYGHTHADYDTVSAGQFSRAGSRQLRTLSFNTLVVDQASWALHHRSTVEELTETLIEVCESGSPFLLTAAHDLPRRGYANWRFTETGPEIQMPATLRTLQVEERAGEGDTRYFSVAFTEYRDPVVQREGRGRKRAGGKKFPRTIYLYADGTARDEQGNRIGNPPAEPVTMRLLARKFYGDQFAWEGIAKKNKITWGPTDALIGFPMFRRRFDRGQQRTKLVIPPPPDRDAPKVIGSKAQPTTGGGAYAIDARTGRSVILGPGTSRLRG